MDIDRAWAAGFWDGEGYAGFAGKKQPSLRAQIQQSEKSILERFQTIVGCGRLHGPYTRKSQRPHWQLSFSSVASVRQLFDVLSPYLYVTKKSQLEAAIAAYDQYKEGLLARRRGQL